MKTSTAGQRAILASRQFFLIDLYQITLSGGTVLRYCGGDADITIGAAVYSAGGQVGPYFATKDARAKGHWKIGKDVDTLVFDVLPGNATILGLPFLWAAQQGVFDDAELTWSVVPLAAYTGPTVVTDPAIVMFVGRLAEIDVRRSGCTFNVASHLELLNQLFPRDLFQAGCINTLFDASCTLAPAGFSDNGVVGAGSTASVIMANLSRASGTYDQGRVKLTSGANSGLSRSNKSWTAGTGGGVLGTLSIWPPLPAAPVAGDTFTVTFGCDKTQATCVGRFNNLANRRSFDFTPVPETALGGGTVTQGGGTQWG